MGHGHKQRSQGLEIARSGKEPPIEGVDFTSETHGRRRDQDQMVAQTEPPEDSEESPLLRTLRRLGK